ncbi:MAG: hypothetical protein ACI9GW_003437 [Halieaceae bacterium]|jgi:hypothetical protein
MGARQQEKLDDFGDEHYRQGLDHYINTLDAHLVDEQFRLSAASRISRNLGTRLRINEALRREPAIAHENIAQPLFLTGLPRTGTSALLNLLATDPATRTLRNWETTFPDPLPGHQPGDIDPRRQYVADAIAEQRARNPGFDKIHYVDTDTSEECVMIHALAFDGVMTGFEILLEPYASWFQSHSLLPLYQYFKKILQCLQWRESGERWLLKAPAHMWAIGEIVETFGAVGVLWGHRHPREVIPSISSMTSMIVKMFGGSIPELEDEKLGPLVMQFYANSLRSGLEKRNQLPDNIFLDYAFAEFVDSPLALVERIYEHYGLTLDEPVSSAIQAHILKNPKGKHGSHSYNYAQYGLSEAKIEECFDFYIADPKFNRHF